MGQKVSKLKSQAEALKLLSYPPMKGVDAETTNLSIPKELPT
jgi:hypothetical protein